MFVAHDVLLNVSFGVARPRLVSLASTRALADASRAAYQEGLTRTGPGARPGVQLARVRFLPPVERADSIAVGMRWEANGVSAGLFPVLDADITLAAADECTTVLTLSGIYRPPGEHPGPALLGAPISAGAGAPAQPPSGPSAAPGLMADVAVRALLRHTARHLTR